MKLALLLLIFLSAAPASAQNAGPEVVKKDFPCLLSDFRVASPTELRIRCRVPWREKFDLAGDIVEVRADGQWMEATRRDVRLTTTLDERRWIRVTLEPQSAPLESGKTYALRTRETYIVDGTPLPYERQTLDISTKPVVVVAPFGVGSGNATFESGGRRLYLMEARIAIDLTTLSAGTLGEDPGPRPLDALFERYKEDVASSGGIGRAHIRVADPGPRSLNSHLTMGGVKDVLGGTFQIPAKQRLKLPGAPKDKDSADYYFRFLHQAGAGSKPGYAVDLKLAPAVKNLGNGLFLKADVLADLGLRQIEGTKVSDMIKTGLGVTKLFFTGGGAVPAIQLTPVASFETDRTWHHRNVLLDADAQFFGRGWLKSTKSKNEKAYAEVALKAVNAGDDPPDSESLTSASWGWQLQMYVGGEIGGALSAEDAESSDESTSVTVPTYTIARVRPKLSAMVERGRFSVSVTVVPRYLFANEVVTRERAIASPDDPTKTVKEIYVEQAQHWMAYGEGSINWQLDTEGHYSLTSTYKVGRLPPNFDAVKTVQTGVTIKF